MGLSVIRGTLYLIRERMFVIRERLAEIVTEDSCSDKGGAVRGLRGWLIRETEFGRWERATQMARRGGGSVPGWNVRDSLAAMGWV